MVTPQEAPRRLLVIQEAMMSLSQTLPTIHAAPQSGAAAHPGSWRRVPDHLRHILALTRRLLEGATDNAPMSAHMLRDVGLVRDESSHFGVWNHCPMDYRP
jgi:uncharacterized protein YjiS (DUF1127 family)